MIVWVGFSGSLHFCQYLADTVESCNCSKYFSRQAKTDEVGNDDEEVRNSDGGYGRSGCRKSNLTKAVGNFMSFEGRGGVQACGSSVSP